MINRRGLTEQQRAVVATIRMRLTGKQALIYMEGEGYKMSRGTYGRLRRKIKADTLKRLHYIAGFGFEDQHLARIDTVDHIEALMWKEYLLEKSAYKRTLILKEIKELQPYISTYYETTKEVLKNSDGPGQNTGNISNDKTAERPRTIQKL